MTKVTVLAICVIVVEVIILINIRKSKKYFEAKAAMTYNPKKDKVVVSKDKYGVYTLDTIKNGIHSKLNMPPYREETCLFSWAKNYR